MKRINLTLILVIAIFTTSCSSLVSMDYAESDFTPIERSFYTQNSIINKSLFADIKAKEESRKPKKEKTAIEEVNAIHSMVMNSFVTDILSEAETYLGTPYRYGGTTRRGIDCSAFIQRVFEIFDYELPRVSRAQAQEGHPISLDEIRAGDLVFFATRGGRRVSHVGIVHNVSDDGDVEFIHAATSQGVTITPLSNSYWNKRFLYAKRILEF